MSDCRDLKLPSILQISGNEFMGLRKHLESGQREDIHVTFVGHDMDDNNVYYIYDDQELLGPASEEFLLSYFDMYGSSPGDDEDFRYHHEHVDGVYFSWWKPMANDRYLCILFSEGVEGVNAREEALAMRWPEPSGGLIVDTELGDIHFIDFNIVELELPEVFLSLDEFYRPEDGYDVFRHYIDIVKEFITENLLPPPDNEAKLPVFS